jgi:hypothetical protein
MGCIGSGGGLNERIRQKATAWCFSAVFFFLPETVKIFQTLHKLFTEKLLDSTFDCVILYKTKLGGMLQAFAAEENSRNLCEIILRR